MKAHFLNALLISTSIVLGLLNASPFASSQPPQPRQQNTTSSSDHVPITVHQAHSELFHGVGGHKGKLMERRQKEGDVAVIVGEGTPFFPDHPATLSDIIADRTCKSDAALIGSVVEKSSFLTKDEDWVFTDHVVKAEEVFANNPASQILPADQIVVARSGGTVRFSDGHSIKVVDGAPLEVGEKYLLFLKYVPQSGGYTTIGSFLVKNGKAFNLSKHPLPDEADDHSLDLSALERFINPANPSCTKTPVVAK